MSLTLHAVVRGPSFIGLGKRPDLTPAHQVDLETGIGPLGPKIEDTRTNPSSGNERPAHNAASVTSSSFLRICSAFGGLSWN